MDAPPDFFSAFWPNLAATALGVVFAVPVGLYVNRLVVARSQRAQAAEERRRLVNALSVVVENLQANLPSLGNISKAYKSPTETAFFDSQLDTAPWEAVRSEVVEHLGDPGLQGRLAAHFADIDRLNRLAQLHFEYGWGMLSSLSGSEKVRGPIRERVGKLAEALEAQAADLVTEVENVRSASDPS
jgi:hypothetical protein